MPLFSRLDDDSELHKVTVTKSKRACCCQASVTEVDGKAQTKEQSRTEQSPSDEDVIK